MRVYGKRLRHLQQDAEGGEAIGFCTEAVPRKLRRGEERVGRPSHRVLWPKLRRIGQNLGRELRAGQQSGWPHRIRGSQRRAVNST